MNFRFLVALAFAGSLSLSAAPPVDGAKAGVDAAVLQRIGPGMKQLDALGRLACSGTLVLRHGTFPHLDATGWADIEANKPMKSDGIFQVKSMTKPFDWKQKYANC